LGWGLAVELPCGMGNPPRVRVGFGEVRSTKFSDHGGSGRRSSPVGVVWAVPVLGFGRKRAWEHAQDATRPRIRPVWPSAQRRGVRRGATVLDRRQGWFGQKGCAMAYTSVQKGTRGRRRSSPRFGSKGRPARSARRRRSAAEEGRHSRSERCRASPGSLLHGWTRSVSTKHKPGLDGADPHRRREIAMADCPHLRAAQHGTRKVARACGAALR